VNENAIRVALCQLVRASSGSGRALSHVLMKAHFVRLQRADQRMASTGFFISLSRFILHSISPLPQQKLTIDYWLNEVSLPFIPVSFALPNEKIW
jgi:hypothetical protein